jgi:hypothetical protein
MLAAGVVIILFEAAAAIMLATPPQLFSAALLACGTSCFGHSVNLTNGVLVMWIALGLSVPLLFLRRVGRPVAGLVQLLILGACVYALFRVASGVRFEFTNIDSRITQDRAMSIAITWSVLAAAGAVSLFLSARPEPAGAAPPAG